CQGEHSHRFHREREEIRPVKRKRPRRRPGRLRPLPGAPSKAAPRRAAGGQISGGTFIGAACYGIGGPAARPGFARAGKTATCRAFWFSKAGFPSQAAGGGSTSRPTANATTSGF